MQAQWVYTRSLEVGQQYEAKRYYWLSAAKQIGKLTIVPRLDDLKNVQQRFTAKAPKTYKSHTALAAFECSTGRTYRVSGKMNTYFEGSMGTGLSVLAPSDADTGPWHIGPPHGEGSRLDMVAVCAYINRNAAESK
jgi:hypothetical protein